MDPKVPQSTHSRPLQGFQIIPPAISLSLIQFSPRPRHLQARRYPQMQVLLRRSRNSLYLQIAQITQQSKAVDNEDNPYKESAEFRNKRHPNERKIERADRLRDPTGSKIKEI